MLRIKIILTLFIISIILKIFNIINISNFIFFGSLLFILLLSIVFVEELRILSITVSNNLFHLKTRFNKENGIIGYKPINNEHIAIIFPTIYEFNYPDVYSCEIKPLIDHYKNINANYQIYLCYHVRDFINIVRSPYVIGLHIFGHGKTHHLPFKDGGIYYREFYYIENKKDFVCQWHCNTGKFKDQHLGHIANRYYVPYGLRNKFNNRSDIKKLIEGNLDWKP